MRVHFTNPDASGETWALFRRLADAGFGLEAATEHRTVHGISPESAERTVRDALDGFVTLERCARINVPRDVRHHVDLALEALNDGHVQRARAEVARAGSAFEAHFGRRRWYAEDDRLEWDS